MHYPNNSKDQIKKRKKKPVYDGVIYDFEKFNRQTFTILLFMIIIFKEKTVVRMESLNYHRKQSSIITNLVEKIKFYILHLW